MATHRGDELAETSAQLEEARKEIVEWKRKDAEQTAVLDQFGEFLCINGVTHSPAHKGCLYCERDEAQEALLIAERAINNEIARGHLIVLNLDVARLQLIAEGKVKNANNQ